MAYDAVRGEVVLYGGFYGSTYFDDTWVYDGVTWTQRFPSQGPGQRRRHAMAYDAARGRVVLFGGRTPAGRADDTWEWDGNDWVQRDVSPRPGARESHVMAYDSVRQRVVLFGGQSAFGSSQTWEWDGSTWTQRLPTTTPTAGTADSAAFDPVRGRFVLVQGSSTAQPTRTWEWDGTAWTERLGEQPEPLMYGAAAYHAATARVVLFGSVYYSLQQAQTWTLGAPARCAQAFLAASFSPGTGTSSADASLSLGPPDGRTVSLGRQGTLVLKIEATDGPGADLTVHERGATAGEVNENYEVEASLDGLAYHWLGVCAGGSCSYDLAAAGLAAARFIRLTDLAPDEPSVPAGTSGADVDAVTGRTCAETCNGLDDDADLVVDDGCDDDGDGFCDVWRIVIGTPAVCPSGGGDCQDEDPAIRPGGPQACNGVNDDCNDPSWPAVSALETDADADSYRVCAGDCNDARADTYPGAAQLCDGLNQDCSDPGWPQPPAAEIDHDGDAFIACADCDDADTAVYPGAPQLCDGLATDCNDPAWPDPPADELDADGDSYRICAGDCNDGNPAVSPAALEQVADGVDQNCDGAELCWRDVDQDDFGVPFPIPSSDLDCNDAGEAWLDTDCNDGDPSIRPGALEAAGDEVDQNCDGAELCYRDLDLDTFGTPITLVSPNLSCRDALESRNNLDCNDALPAVNPAAVEACNGLDDDCDTLVDEDALGEDTDADGVANLCDNCPQAVNPDQLDTDHDTRGNACDNCLLVANPDQLDPDADARGTACDNCPLSFNPAQDDTDVDRIGDVCDNCLLDYNESQSDADLDQEGDVCDLDDGIILLFRIDPDFVEWQAETGPTAWNVYQGDLAVLRSSGVYTQLPGTNPLAERDCGVIGFYVSDSDTPPVGAVQFSLVTGIVGSVEGSLGQDSTGTERPNANPCP
jgi:hypothetical protein